MPSKPRSEERSTPAAYRTYAEGPVTLQSHILQQEALEPAADSSFSWILSALSISAKIIAARVRRARLDDDPAGAGAHGPGDAHRKLDVMANDVLMRTIGGRDGVAIIASEENAEPVLLRTSSRGEHQYCILFDPLDGSSNLDVCGGVGTIFSILEHDRALRPEDSLLQPGAHQVAAGYVLYGSSTVFVLTIGSGVDMFVLDPSIGAFVRVAEKLRIPDTGKNYSVNEGHRRSFPTGFQRYLDWAQAHDYTGRYVGAMVADMHRILLKGGVFLYPPTAKSPQGKLRLMYEANPIAMVIEQAGGAAFAGPDVPILSIVPKDIHQRTPVILGSAAEVEHVLRHLRRG
jgi:fructose-1,6-bisphosphatase I